MKWAKSQVSFLGIAVILLVLAACAGGVKVGDLPVYPGAVELKAGESRIGDTLVNNMKQDAALRQAIGAGGKTEQRGFRLPAGVSWEKVKAFYAGELKTRGWESGLGGIAGGFVDVNAMMGAVSKDNDLFQTNVWTKGKQTLSVVMVTSPTDASQKELILSLSSR
jgi:hypothetical protein